MNRAVTVIDCDEEVMVSSPNSTVSSLSGKRSEREENDGESLDLDDDGGDAAARKKLRLSKEQAAVLEETFKEHNTLNPVSAVSFILSVICLTSQGHFRNISNTDIYIYF